MTDNARTEQVATDVKGMVKEARVLMAEIDPLVADISAALPDPVPPHDNLRTAKGILLGVFIGLCLWVGGFCLAGVVHHG
jgi:hypothetical protein